MPPTLQNTRAQRNAALASSSSSGHVVNVRYWGKADIARTGCQMTQSGQQTGATDKRLDGAGATFVAQEPFQ
jgi:hypothetical protein